MKDKNGVEIKEGHIVKTEHGNYHQVFKSTHDVPVILDETRNTHEIDGDYHYVYGKFIRIDNLPISTWEVINP